MIDALVMLGFTPVLLAVIYGTHSLPGRSRRR